MGIITEDSGKGREPFTVMECGKVGGKVKVTPCALLSSFMFVIFSFSFLFFFVCDIFFLIFHCCFRRCLDKTFSCAPIL